MEKYDSAAIRHFEDAQLLRTSGKLDNAGHLVGLAAECAIKHNIASLKPPPLLLHYHLPKLLSIARKHLNGRGPHSSSKMLALVKRNEFSDWKVDRRYYQTGNTTTNELVKWFKETKSLFVAANLKVRQ